MINCECLNISNLNIRYFNEINIFYYNIAKKSKINTYRKKKPFFFCNQ